MKMRQSGIIRSEVPYQPYQSSGLLLRGVVMATYVLDDPGHPKEDENDIKSDAVAVYCDVLTYGSRAGSRFDGLNKVQVVQNAGMHDGHVWYPKASTMDITGDSLDKNTTGLANMDGDHVLVGFLDDNLNQPVVLGRLFHPSADVGNEENAIGNRLRLKQVDGRPDFWKHHGSFHGVDKLGNHIVDTRFANDGKLDAKGNEAAAPTTNDKGNQTRTLPLEATHKVEHLDMSQDPPKVEVLIQTDKTQHRVEVPIDATIHLAVIDTAGPTDKSKIVMDKDTYAADIQGTKVYIDNTLIELGGQGSGDKAVLESKNQTEIKLLKLAVKTLSDELDLHEHAMTQYVPPLLFIPGTQVDAIRMPQAIATEGGQVVIPDLTPSIPPDPRILPTAPFKFTKPASVNATNSDLVTIDS